MSKINEYTNSVIDFVKKKYMTRINRIVIYGEAANPDNPSPASFDVAVGLVDSDDIYDFDMLGDILSFIGDIVTSEDCSLLPISDKVMSQYILDSVDKGVEIYSFNA